MANIAIVNYCNLKCKYCFADDMIQEDLATMSVEDFCKVLEFLSRTPKNHVGIIGGEPTLHPQFGEILKETNRYCRELNTEATLFTNGIELEKWMPDIGERIHLLINCNSPEFQSSELFNKQRQTLDHLADLSWLDDCPDHPAKASCGCNIYIGCDDYSYIWDIVDRYRLRHLRTSVVSPAACYAEWRTNKEGYYNTLKPKYLKFCEDALKHHCTLGMDCGHIPTCYFTREEAEIAREACSPIMPDGGRDIMMSSFDKQEFCEPVVDITPDFKATACFGSYDPVDIRDFRDLIELERYLLIMKNYPKAQANCTGKCTTCKKHKLLQCNGGCLGFAEVK